MNMTGDIFADNSMHSTICAVSDDVWFCTVSNIVISVSHLFYDSTEGFIQCQATQLDETRVCSTCDKDGLVMVIIGKIRGPIHL